MKMKKLGAKVIATVLMIGVLPLNVLAAPQSRQVQVTKGILFDVPTPYWTNFDAVIPTTYTDGNTVCAEVYAEAMDSDKKITGSMTLQKYSSGRWSSVASWSVSGTGSFVATKEYTKGVEGVSYRTKVTLKIGTETVTVISDACTV